MSICIFWMFFSLTATLWAGTSAQKPTSYSWKLAGGFSKKSRWVTGWCLEIQRNGGVTSEDCFFLLEIWEVSTFAIQFCWYSYMICVCFPKIIICIYIYTYEPGPRTPDPHPPTPPPKPRICMLFKSILELPPPICMLFAAFESHNLVTRLCLAVYF